MQNLTIEEIIGLGRSPYTGFFGRLRAEDRKVVDDAIATMGIEKLRGRNEFRPFLMAKGRR